MRFGVCVSTPAEIEILARAGYDFCELPARAVLPFEDDVAALDTMRELDAAPLRAESFNSLVPGELPLCGPNADLSALRTYLRRAFSRMAHLGAQVVVLGSGAARHIPEGYPRSDALDQLADALSLASDEAARAGIELALEHLNTKESNVFTTLAESQEFIERRGLSNARLLVDLHHLELENEPFEHVIAAAPLIAHVHVADGGRGAPGVGGYDYAGFMKAVRATGYDRRISAECSWTNLGEQAAPSLAFMRAQWLG